MGIFDGFAEGLAAAVDDIRHKVVEEPMYGREVTGNIELPQQQEQATAQEREPSHNDLYVQPPSLEMER